MYDLFSSAAYVNLIHILGIVILRAGYGGSYMVNSGRSRRKLGRD